MYSYKNRDNELVSLPLDELINTVKNYGSYVALASKLNTTIEEVKNIIEELQKMDSNISYKTEQYKPWSPEEDEQLEKEYRSNMTVKEISEKHGRTHGAIRARLKHKNLYIDNTDIKSITTKDPEKESGMFRILFDEESRDEIFFYNINEKEDNIDPTRPIFNELFNTEIGYKNDKFGFVMLDKSQYIPEKIIKEKPVILTRQELMDLKISHLTEYIPKWCNRDDANSNRIIDLKNRYQSAINYYYELTYKWLSDRHLLTEDTIITVVPSHEASAINENGMADIARKLVENTPVIDGINLVVRKTTINKKSTSMFRPSLTKDIDSLDINLNMDLSNKKIVILDDVTTHGDGFRAVTYHLCKNGAKKIIPLAMGKTVIPDE